MEPNLIAPQSHYEQVAFDLEQERAEAQRLLAERQENAVKLGEHFSKVKRFLRGADYVAYVKSLGLIVPVAEGYITQAKRARGEVTVRPVQPRAPTFTKGDLKEMLAALKKGEVEAVIAALEEIV